MKHSVNRLAIAAAQAALALAGTMAAGTASAQVVGLYQGVTSQGQLIEIQLTEDGIGTLVFGGGTVFWQATCSRSGPGRSVAWGIGANTPLDGQQVTHEFRGNSLYERWRMFFAGNNVSGTFIGRTPEYVDPFASSRQVQLCDSGTLNFTATLVPGAKPSAPVANGQAVQIK